MKALSKENTPFVNEVTPTDQNNNVRDEDNKGSNKEVNLDNSREKKLFCLYIFVNTTFRDSCWVRLARWTCS